MILQECFFLLCPRLALSLVSLDLISGFTKKKQQKYGSVTVGGFSPPKDDYAEEPVF